MLPPMVAQQERDEGVVHGLEIHDLVHGLVDDFERVLRRR